MFPTLALSKSGYGLKR